MEYFRLEQDKRIPYAVWIRKLSLLQGFFEAYKGNVGALNDMNVVEVKTSKYNRYPDVLDQQLFLVKENVKDVIDMYETQMEYRGFCILEGNKDNYERYYAPLLTGIDCIADINMYIANKHSLVINKDKIAGGSHIFRISNIQEQIIIVDLEIAESLLRRRIKGIRLTHIDAKE